MELENAKANLKNCLLGGMLILGGNEWWFLQIWVSLSRKQERKKTTQAILWHDAMSSGQINQFKFASHVSKLSNAGRLHPDSDVHSTAVYHPKKYPGAAWASFPLASPSPAAVPGGIWHQTDLPFPCLWTMSLSPPPPPHSFAQSPMKTPTQSPIHSLYRREGFLCICNTWVLSTCSKRNQCKGNQVLGKGVHGFAPPATSHRDTQHLVHPPKDPLRPGWPSSNKKGFQCNLGKAWTDHRAVTNLLSQSLAFLGGPCSLLLPGIPISSKCH